jgi:predicted flap endonuclease-1-like 5' DNA nuclease
VEEQLELARRTIAAKDAEIRALVAQRDARIAELESLRNQLAARELNLREFEFAAMSHDAKVRELEKELETARMQGGQSADDLKLIRGIGPAFERELKRNGVHTFAQIAGWTPADIDAIAPKIKARAERIKRDNWVQRAAELAAQKTRS